MRLRKQSLDVVLLAHVGYDVEAIGPFLDALEAAARRSCVAVLMEQVPASGADPFWPLVHAESRQSLPALPEFVALLQARGRAVRVSRLPVESRRFDSRAALEGFVRRQLWIDPAGAKEKRFQEALDLLAVEVTGAGASGWTIRGRAANDIGIVSWQAQR